MSIIRINKTTDYTVMSNEHLRDRRLSLKAKGLMSEMLSLPEDWDYSIAGLAAINKEAQSAIESALRELKDAGYLIVTKLTPDKTDSGRYEYQYDLYEHSQEEKQGVKKQGVENQGVEFLGVEFQGVENRLQINKDILNKDKQNTKELNKEEEYRVLFASCGYLLGTEEGEYKELMEALAAFEEMRKKIKKPLTDRALKMIIKRLISLSSGDSDLMVKILDRSVRKSWQDVYPYQDDGAREQASVNPFAQLLEE